MYAEIKAKNLPYETIMTNEEEYITAFNYRDQMAYRWFFQDGICIKTYWMFDCSLTKAVNHTLSQDMPVHNEQGAFYNPDSGLLFINTGFTDEQTGYCILAITKTTQKYD